MVACDEIIKLRSVFYMLLTQSLHHGTHRGYEFYDIPDTYCKFDKHRLSIDIPALEKLVWENAKDLEDRCVEEGTLEKVARHMKRTYFSCDSEEVMCIRVSKAHLSKDIIHQSDISRFYATENVTSPVWNNAEALINGFNLNHLGAEEVKRLINKHRYSYFQ